MRDPAHIATWLSIAAVVGTGAMGYGVLTQRVAASEEAIKDAKPVVERIAKLEANQQNTNEKIDQTNALILQLIAQQREAAKAAQEAADAARREIHR